MNQPICDRDPGDETDFLTPTEAIERAMAGEYVDLERLIERRLEDSHRRLVRNLRLEKEGKRAIWRPRALEAKKLGTNLSWHPAMKYIRGANQ